MTLLQAFVWNLGTFHVMLRENPISGSPTKGKSIGAHEGGGSSCISEEVLVMRMERRE